MVGLIKASVGSGFNKGFVALFVTNMRIPLVN